MTGYSKISADQADMMLESEDYVLVDVRTPSEYNGLHAAPAKNFPLQDLSENSVSALQGKKIICICQGGMRGQKAAEFFCEQGFSQVFNVEGGTSLWSKAGLPVVKGKSSISIERQVRIVAGFLVLLGTLSGIFISAYFLAIPILVGFGLMFAGIIDTCGMALLLARCPWNAK